MSYVDDHVVSLFDSSGFSCDHFLGSPLRFGFRPQSEAFSHRAEGFSRCRIPIARLSQGRRGGLSDFVLGLVHFDCPPIAIGRKNYLFVGSQIGEKATAIAYILIETDKLNGVDPQAWLADTLARIPDYKIARVDDLLPWNAR